MKKLRLLLSAVLGLTLLVQGFGVAAATPAPVADDVQAAAAAMPCHGDSQDAAKTCPCCDHGCPDMVNCALGHMAGAPATGLPLPPAAQAVIAATPRSVEAVVFPSLLRPPIPSHA